MDRSVILPSVRRSKAGRKLSFLQKGKDTSLEEIKHLIRTRQDWERTICELKIDGIRAVYYGGHLITYSMKRVYNCDPIIKEIQKVAHPDDILDGELYGTSWENTQSVVMSSKAEKSLGSIQFHAFDWIPRMEFERGVGFALQCDRKLKLRSLLDKMKQKYVTPVTEYKVGTYREFKKLYQEAIDAGYEGMMLKSTLSPYLFYRGEAWRKIKHTETTDVKVVGYKPGKGKYSGTLGSLICEDEHGNEINVSGMSDVEREMIWNQKRSHLGRMVEVKFYKRTVKGNLYSAQFIRWRDDKAEL